ncbi:MAG TPA: hypothetical protein VIV60_19050, partial [Polyangiaceae bacterium]
LCPMGITQFVVKRQHQEEVDDYMVTRIPFDCLQVVVGAMKRAYVKVEAPKVGPPLSSDHVEIQRLTRLLNNPAERNDAAGRRWFE